MLDVQDYGRRESCRRVGVLLAVDQQGRCRNSVKAGSLTRLVFVGPLDRDETSDVVPHSKKEAPREVPFYTTRAVRGDAIVLGSRLWPKDGGSRLSRTQKLAAP